MRLDTLPRHVLALGAMLLVTLGLLVTVWIKLGGDEHAACLIQQRGLPASRELAYTMKAAYGLFTDPQSRAQAAQQAPPTRQQAIDLDQLRTHLGKYARLEARQPLSRSC